MLNQKLNSNESDLYGMRFKTLSELVPNVSERNIGIARIKFQFEIYLYFLNTGQLKAKLVVLS